MAPQNSSPRYIPGVCNIGLAERKSRRMSGIISLAVAVILAVILWWLGAPKWWRLLLILPVAGAASGFLQDQLHFCAGFGMKGLYNVVNSVGVTDSVSQAEYRQKDKRKAQMILGLSAVIGVVVGVLSVL